MASTRAVWTHRAGSGPLPWRLPTPRLAHTPARRRPRCQNGACALRCPPLRRRLRLVTPPGREIVPGRPRVHVVVGSMARGPMGGARRASVTVAGRARSGRPVGRPAPQSDRALGVVCAVWLVWSSPAGLVLGAGSRTPRHHPRAGGGLGPGHGGCGAPRWASGGAGPPTAHPHKSRFFEQVTWLPSVWHLVGDAGTHKTQEGSHVVPGQY
jgi:hypothetical protein